MRVGLFVTCLIDLMRPEIGFSVIKLIEGAGFEVVVPPAQTCCGQMHANTGFRGEAYSQAKRFVHLYRETECVVIPSSSCVAMIRDQYPGLFEELGNDGLRKEFAALLPRVFELSEFLTDKLGIEDVGSYFPHRVTYHASCHGVRGIHVGEKPFRLLSKVLGLELVPVANLDRCCGFGGTFSVKNAEVSTAMRDSKLQDLLATKAEYCTALDNSCLMHLGGALHRRSLQMKPIHLAEILASTEESAQERAG